jgi:hypothetical protein
VLEFPQGWLSMQNIQSEYKGRVMNGVVVLDGGSKLPDGTEVRVTPVQPKQSTLGQRLLELSGIAEGLPSDLAENHDHYLHGLPKNK